MATEREPKDWPSLGDIEFEGPFHEPEAMDLAYVNSPLMVEATMMDRAEKFPGGEWLQRPPGQGPEKDSRGRIAVQNRIQPMSSFPTDLEKLIVSEVKGFRDFSGEILERTAGRLMLWMTDKANEPKSPAKIKERDVMIGRLIGNRLSVTAQADALVAMNLRRIMTLSALSPFHSSLIEDAEEAAQMNIIHFQQEGYELAAASNAHKVQPLRAGEGSWATRKSFLEATLYNPENAELFDLIGHSVHVTYADAEGEPKKVPIGRAQTLVRRYVPRSDS